MVLAAGLTAVAIVEEEQKEGAKAAATEATLGEGVSLAELGEEVLAAEAIVDVRQAEQKVEQKGVQTAEVSAVVAQATDWKEEVHSAVPAEDLKVGAMAATMDRVQNFLCPRESLP